MSPVAFSESQRLLREHCLHATSAVHAEHWVGRVETFNVSAGLEGGPTCDCPAGLAGERCSHLAAVMSLLFEQAINEMFGVVRADSVGASSC